jgi:hypothetical protein
MESMPDYDAGFKMVARTAGRPLSRLAAVTCQHWEPIGGEVHAIERLADRAFRARQGNERFVVYMEAYTRWHQLATWSVLAKSGLLSEREHLPTLSLIYVLLPRGYHAQDGTFRLAVAAAPTQQVWFREVCFWQQEPQPWWEEFPGLMALYPLCRHRRSRKQAVAHAAEAIVARTPNHILRADLLTTLAIFGKLVYPTVDVLAIIGREQMKESKFYEEVREEGRVEERRNALLDTLDLRFGSGPTAELAEDLRGLNDLGQLAELNRVAVTCRRLADFRRALAEATAGT